MATGLPQGAPESLAPPRPDSAFWNEARDLPPLLARVRPLSMLANDVLIDIARIVRTILMLGIPGDFVECGVWRGGTSLLIAQMLRLAGVRDRKVWLFDSFQGVPPPKEVDGLVGKRFAEDTSSPYYYQNYSASLDDVQQSVSSLGLQSSVELVKGWFDQTLPRHRARVGGIALLRLDCDWYESVRCGLENFYGQVADGGFVSLDDYYYCDGASLAVHEFLGAHRLAHRIESMVGTAAGIEVPSRWSTGMEPYEVAYRSAVIRKVPAEEPTWGQLRRIYLAVQDITATVGPEDRFILVDYHRLIDQFCAGLHPVPLLGTSREQARRDNRSILQAVERHRAAGVRYLVFAWPSFWWVKGDGELNRALRSQFRCLLENERVVILDLRQEPSEILPPGVTSAGPG